MHFMEMFKYSFITFIIMNKNHANIKIIALQTCKLMQLYSLFSNCKYIKATFFIMISYVPMSFS